MRRLVTPLSLVCALLAAWLVGMVLDSFTSGSSLVEVAIPFVVIGVGTYLLLNRLVRPGSH